MSQSGLCGLTLSKCVCRPHWCKAALRTLTRRLTLSLTVICFSRFMLDLRGIYFAGRDGREADTTLHLSDVKFEGFTSTMIGNLGSTTHGEQVEIPGPEPTEDSNSSPGPESADALERRYVWEWHDEEVELSDDPFRAGFQSLEKRPAFFATVAEASETGEAEKVDGTEFKVSDHNLKMVKCSPLTKPSRSQDTQIGDISPV